MRSLGLAIKKNEVWYSVVEGNSMDDSYIVETGKQNFRAESHGLMLDFYNIFLELITKYKPDSISYKLSLDIKMGQIPYLHYSLGVLNFLCLQQSIPAIERSSKWITAGKRSKIASFAEMFPDVSFKNEQLASSVIAWYGIGE
jgi:hypothetical protein